MISQYELKKYLNYDHNTGIFTWIFQAGRRVKVGMVAGTVKEDGRIEIALNRKKYKAHRLAWLYIHGEYPINQIDHINGNSLDNRINNLREATQQQNMQNKRAPQSNNKSGVLGVSFCKKSKKFMAQIGKNGKQKRLGYFVSPKEAHEAYLKAKRELHEFCTI